MWGIFFLFFWHWRPTSMAALPRLKGGIALCLGAVLTSFTVLRVEWLPWIHTCASLAVAVASGGVLTQNPIALQLYYAVYLSA